MAEQELRQPVAGTGAVDHEIGPGAGEVPDRLFLWRRDVDRDELAGPIEVRETAGVRVSVFTLAPGATGMRLGAITSQATPRRCSKRASS